MLFRASLQETTKFSVVSVKIERLPPASTKGSSTDRVVANQREKESVCDVTDSNARYDSVS